MPRLSVVTPVLNGEKYLAATIRSVLAQSFDDWEYLIVDGGSTDKTLDIAGQFAQQDERIRVLSVRDEGMYDALFQGFERTGGEILTWINSDDVLMPWAFSVAERYMDKYQVEWVGGLVTKANHKGDVFLVCSSRWCPQSFIERGLYHERLLGSLQQEGMFFKRSLIKRSKERIEYIRTLKYAGDFVLWKEFAKWSPLYEVPTALAAFRIHGDNLSRRHMDEYLREIRANTKYYVPKAVGLLLRRLSAPFFGGLSLIMSFYRSRRMRSLFEPGFNKNV